MKRPNRTTLVSAGMLAAGLWLLSGCNEASTSAQGADNAARQSVATPSRYVRSGTTITVALGSAISSETAKVGDTWHGTLTEGVTTQNGTDIPAGSAVTGVVSGVVEAKRGSRAMLDLAVRSVRVDGRDEQVDASAESVIAGSTRARNLGAIAGGAAAGAIIGKIVGDGKNAAVGAVIGGAAATGVVAGSKGYQVVLPDGTVMSFTVGQTVAIR